MPFLPDPNYRLIGFALLAVLLSPLINAADKYNSQILRHFSIYEKRDAYCAWPAIARTKSGDLVVLFTRTEEHMAPNGEILLSRSTDNGETWIPPAVVYDTILDDRESGVTTLSDGSLLAHFRSVRFTRATYESMPTGSYEQGFIDRWIGYVEKPEYANATALNRAWHAISDDNGFTWSQTTPGHDTIHGGVHLQNGSFLVASYRDDAGNIGLYASDETLGEWNSIASIVCPRPDTIRFGEPHIIQLNSGRVIMMIRATAIPYDDQSPDCQIWGTYSDDNGTTWAKPYQTPLWGFPPHLLQLSDGRVLCSYGYRRQPFGERVCISQNGIDWNLENEIILRDDAANGDLGYPVSIELETGKILTVYYQPNIPKGSTPATHPPLPNRKKPGIMGTIWKIDR
ncbi:MAG: sialidase family protein [Opitutales bacterium]